MDDDSRLDCSDMDQASESYLRTIASLRAQLAQAEKDKTLLKSLLDILGQYVGETGVSEGAVEVLQRKLNELAQVTADRPCVRLVLELHADDVMRLKTQLAQVM